MKLRSQCAVAACALGTQAESQLSSSQVQLRSIAVCLEFVASRHEKDIFRDWRLCRVPAIVMSSQGFFLCLRTESIAEPLVLLGFALRQQELQKLAKNLQIIQIPLFPFVQPCWVPSPVEKALLPLCFFFSFLGFSDLALSLLFEELHSDTMRDRHWALLMAVTKKTFEKARERAERAERAESTVLQRRESRGRGGREPRTRELESSLLCNFAQGPEFSFRHLLELELHHFSPLARNPWVEVSPCLKGASDLFSRGLPPCCDHVATMRTTIPEMGLFGMPAGAKHERSRSAQVTSW